MPFSVVFRSFCIEMNTKTNKFLLAGDKLMLDIHLKKLGFLYSDSGSTIQKQNKNKKFRETQDPRYIYRIEPDKTCF